MDGVKKYKLCMVLMMLTIPTLFLWLCVVSARSDNQNRRELHAKTKIASQKIRTMLDDTRRKRLEESDFPLLYLEDMDLREVAISGEHSQLASFRGSNLSGKTLTGNTSSFQGALFENSNLANAKLLGGPSSFQGASFRNADLSGAVLAGSFQCASFECAKLVDVQVTVSGSTEFQGVEIDKTQFQGADLSTINRLSLESCYFNDPPLYDENTKFPKGFKPAQQGWVYAKH